MFIVDVVEPSPPHKTNGTVLAKTDRGRVLASDLAIFPGAFSEVSVIFASSQLVFIKTPNGGEGIICLQNEIKILKDLEPHPNIVQLVNDFTDFENFTQLGLPYHPQDLEDVIEKAVVDNKGDFSAVKSVWFLQILQVLVFLHGQNITHRDIKAGNFLITADGCIKLCDFGLANEEGLAGIPDIIPPEQTKNCNGEAISLPAIDMWMVGCLFYYMLIGRNLFSVDRKRGFRKQLAEQHKNFFDCVGEGRKLLQGEIVDYEMWEDGRYSEGGVVVNRANEAGLTLSILLRIFESEPSKRLTASAAVEDVLLEIEKNRSTHLTAAQKRSSTPVDVVVVGGNSISGRGNRTGTERDPTGESVLKEPLLSPAAGYGTRQSQLPDSYDCYKSPGELDKTKQLWCCTIG